MNVLIVGAGIAGPTLAYWLLRAGHRPTLVERAPELRRGGYLIDFWGAGFEVADRMGIIPELLQRSYRAREARQEGRDGARLFAFSPEKFVGKGVRFVSLARSDLAAVLCDALEGKVETIFGDTVTAIEDDGTRVQCTFERGGVRDFDLVVGADGLHSQVRRLVFGPGGAADPRGAGGAAASPLRERRLGGAEHPRADVSLRVSLRGPREPDPHAVLDQGTRRAGG